MNTVQSAWEDYRAKVIPPTAPPVQITETRRAFYAGFAAAFGMMDDISNSLSEDAACAVFDSLETEMVEFAASVVKGEA